METRPCVRCGVQIHPASTRCTLCGSSQRAGLGRPSWWWLTGLAGLVLAGVLVAVVLRGGSGSTQARFRVFQTSGLTTLVPVGWTGGDRASPSGTVTASFEDPHRPDFRLSVSAARPARGTARGRAVKLRSRASTRLDYTLHFFGRALFPGGRPVWLLSFDSDGFAHAIYVDTACQPGIAMTVEISAPDRAQLQSIAAPVAASADPRCR